MVICVAVDCESDSTGEGLSFAKFLRDKNQKVSCLLLLLKS